MIIKRRREITVETERSVTIKFPNKTISFVCPNCAELTEMLSINEAANRSQQSWRAVVVEIEAGALHFVETEIGEIYVCAVSLSAVKQIPEPGAG